MVARSIKDRGIQYEIDYLNNFLSFGTPGSNEAATAGFPVKEVFSSIGVSSGIP